MNLALQRNGIKYFIRICLIILLFLTLPVAVVFCDDAVFYGKGESVWPINNDQVEMSREKVIITVQERGNGDPRNRFFVDCTFVFRNTGDDTNLQIGFPDYPGGELSDFPTIENFQCFINDQPVKVELKKGLPHPLDPSIVFDKVYVWQVDLKRGQMITIRNSYNFDGFAFAGGEREVSYVLRTGALWKGPILRAEIIINGIDTRFIESISPEGYTIYSDSICWSMKNVKPDEDIRLRFIEEWASFARMLDAYFASNEHAETEIREIVRHIGLHLDNLDYKRTEESTIVMQRYIQKILDTISHSYFSGSQLCRMYVFVDQPEKASAVINDEMERIEKQETPYDDLAILHIVDEAKRLKDYKLAIRAKLLYIDHYKPDPLNPWMLASNYSQVGEIYYEWLHDYDNARKYYAMALKEATEAEKRKPGRMNQVYAASSLFKIGKCNLHLKNYVEAKKYFNMVIDEYPASTYIDDAKRELGYIK